MVLASSFPLLNSAPPTRSPAITFLLTRNGTCRSTICIPSVYSYSSHHPCLYGHYYYDTVLDFLHGSQALQIPRVYTTRQTGRTVETMGSAWCRSGLVDETKQKQCLGRQYTLLGPRQCICGTSTSPRLQEHCRVQPVITIRSDSIITHGILIRS